MSDYLHAAAIFAQEAGNLILKDKKIDRSKIFCILYTVSSQNIDKAKPTVM
jgi:3-hydroxy-3-methylglutaryl CoA synthase